MRFLIVPVMLASAAWAQTEATSLLGRPLTSETDPEGRIAKADEEIKKAPRTVESYLKAAQVRAELRQFKSAIATLTKGLEVIPSDPRLLRARGHRQISIRQFAPAVADLEKARSFAPSSFEISYFLGLAQYLKGDFNEAANEFARCINMAGKPDEFAKSLPPGGFSCADLPKRPENLMPLADWHYRSLRKAGRHAEAKEILTNIKPGLQLSANSSNYQALLFYKSAVAEKEALNTTGIAYTNIASGVAVHYLAEGRTGPACSLLRKLVAHEDWPAFGVIAAEVELAGPSKSACALFLK